ncbi:hypothetical protein SBP28_002917 [Candidozyma auris]
MVSFGSGTTPRSGDSERTLHIVNYTKLDRSHDLNHVHFPFTMAKIFTPPLTYSTYLPMTSILRAVAGVARAIPRRFVHHKMSPKDYPKVNVADVDLNPPKYGFRRERKPLLSQSVKDTLFPAVAIKELYKNEGKPVPMKFRGNNDEVARRNYERFQEEVAMGLPHFKVGNKKVYLPKARVILLHPLARHTPYQARFLVPRNFNKLDLRDYLWHVYGLRALNVTVQLTPRVWKRRQNDFARHRSRQLKIMTIDMEEPFVWPKLPEKAQDMGYTRMKEQLEYSKRLMGKSDAERPVDAFDGIFNKTELPNTFVSAKSQKVLKEKVDAMVAKEESAIDRRKVAQFLKL